MSGMKEKIAVVICVYNNSGTLRDVVCRALAQNCAEVVLVNDGCTDCDVEKLLKDLKITLLRHEKNRGKGEALKTALNYLKTREEIRWMITLDADGQHFPEDIPAFLRVLAESPEEDKILIGARDFSQPGRIPERSVKGRSFSNFWLKLETGRSTADAQSGFRCYPVHLISLLRCIASRYDWETEILVRSVWAGLALRDVPVRVEYFTPETRVSHFHAFKDNLRISLINARLVGELLIPLPKKKLLRRKQDFSIFRPKELFLYLLKENNTPSGLATAAAAGTFIAVLPIFMFHTAVILFVSIRLHLNKIMMLAIQNLFMPPFSPFLCIELGHFMLHGKWLTEITFENVALEMHKRLLEWLCGSLILAPLFSILIWIITFAVSSGIRHLLAKKPHAGEEEK